jgi:hypothetical protein
MDRLCGHDAVLATRSDHFGVDIACKSMLID